MCMCVCQQRVVDIGKLFGGAHSAFMTAGRQVAAQSACPEAAKLPVQVVTKGASAPAHAPAQQPFASDEAPHLLAQHECVGCVDQHLELSVVFDAPDAHH